jgi:hypothetical protein
MCFFAINKLEQLPYLVTRYLASISWEYHTALHCTLHVNNTCSLSVYVSLNQSHASYHHTLDLHPFSTYIPNTILFDTINPPFPSLHLLSAATC